MLALLSVHNLFIIFIQLITASNYVWFFVLHLVSFLWVSFACLIKTNSCNILFTEPVCSHWHTCCGGCFFSLLEAKCNLAHGEWTMAKSHYECWETWCKRFIMLISSYKSLFIQLCCSCCVFVLMLSEVIFLNISKCLLWKKACIWHLTIFWNSKIFLFK